MSVAELETLYRAKYGAFVRAAAAISGGEALGAEAVQDAFAKAIRSRTSFRGDAPLEAWVWRIVVNCARSARALEGRQELQREPSGARGAIPSGHDLEVLGWVAALPQRQREAVFLRYFADLDYRSIAVALGVEVGTVSATLSAAHHKLREAMEVPR